MAERTVLHVMPHPGAGGERYIDQLEAIEGFRFERFALTQDRGRMESLRGAREAHVRARDADLVHVHGDAAAILCASLLRRRPGVITFNGLHLLRRSRGIGLRAVRRRLRRAIAASRAAICVSESELADARTVAGRYADRLELIENGIEDPGPPSRAMRISERAKLDLDDREVSVLYAGQLEQRKGVLDLVEALELARSQGAPLAGLIAGDGPLRDQVARRAVAGARLLGSRNDVPMLLEAADVFVMPSEREGLSIAVLEAMAKGRACVVSDGPGNPDAVGEAGVVVPYGQPGALAAALGKLAGDPELRAELGVAARERFLARFTAERMVEQTCRAYERALVGAGA